MAGGEFRISTRERWIAAWEDSKRGGEGKNAAGILKTAAGKGKSRSGAEKRAGELRNADGHGRKTPGFLPSLKVRVCPCRSVPRSYARSAAGSTATLAGSSSVSREVRKLVASMTAAAAQNGALMLSS
jgi:hypothetical protein